jgi:hypothetical protein
MDIKIDKETLKLGDQEVARAELSDNNQKYVHRIEALLHNISDLDMQRSELDLLVSAYGNTLKKSLNPVVEEVN